MFILNKNFAVRLLVLWGCLTITTWIGHGYFNHGLEGIFWAFIIPATEIVPWLIILTIIWGIYALIFKLFKKKLSLQEWDIYLFWVLVIITSITTTLGFIRPNGG